MPATSIIFPAKLKPGDRVAVIAPSLSAKIIPAHVLSLAQERVQALGLRPTLVLTDECDEFRSSSIQSRIGAIHDSFRDSEIRAIFSIIGGYNSNQLLHHLDYELIRQNPKVVCGYSDITVLTNAILARSGLATYSGPHYSNFGSTLFGADAIESFRQCIMSNSQYEFSPSQFWIDEKWLNVIPNPSRHKSSGYESVVPGRAEGTILGGNLCSFILLHGTPYCPPLAESILFLEDDHESGVGMFDRNLQALIQQPDFPQVRGIVLGRFQQGTQMSKQQLYKMILSKPELQRIPVIADVDFGHTFPLYTFPIGGTCVIESDARGCHIRVLTH